MERFGSKRMWLIGLSLFVLDSLASGLSWNVESLIVFRVAQGFGGGMLDLIMPTVLATAAGPALAGRVIGPAGTRLRRPGLRAVAGHRKRPARPHRPHPGDAARVMLFSLLFLVPLYQQRVRGHEALAAGMLLTPLGIGSFLAMPVAGRISDLMGARRLAPLGGLLVALSAFAYTQADARTDEVLLGLVAFVTGVGLGLIGAPTMGALYRTLPQDAVPQGTAALYIINQLGASLGTAVVALILQGQTNAGRTQVAAFQHASRWVLAAALAVLLTGFFLPGKKATVAAAEGSPTARNGTNYAEESSN